MRFIANMYVIIMVLFGFAGAVSAATTTEAAKLYGGTTPIASVGRPSAGSSASFSSEISCADASVIELSSVEIQSQKEFEKGLAHLFGIEGTVQNDIAAVWSFRRASDSNHAWAKVYLSLCHLTGRGILMPDAGADRHHANALLCDVSFSPSVNREAGLWADYLLEKHFGAVRGKTVTIGRHVVKFNPGREILPKGTSEESLYLKSFWMAYFEGRSARFVHGQKEPSKEPPKFSL